MMSYFRLPLAIRMLVVTVLLDACAPPPPRYASDPDRGANLPESSADLVALADDLLSPRSPALEALDRARAALERALEADPRDYEVRWRLSRVCFLMGQRFANKQQRVEVAATGRDHAKTAEQIAPARVEAPYYLALNLANIADAKSKLAVVKPMVAAAKRATAIDASYHGAGPLVFLGKVYLKAPAWPLSVGDVDKAIEVLERAVVIAPRPLTRLFLGQVYLEDEEPQKARAQLEPALSDRGPHQLEPRWRREAEQTLQRIESDN
jgi:tetratricopeptide (TPR) repeat protein